MNEHYAEDYSVIMGIVDLLPVILFAVAGAFFLNRKGFLRFKDEKKEDRN